MTWQEGAKALRVTGWLTGTGREGRRESGREGFREGESCLIQVSHQRRGPAFKNEVANKLDDPAHGLRKIEGEERENKMGIFKGGLRLMLGGGREGGREG